MGMDKAANAAKDVVGKAKEAIGDATGNEKLETQGKVDQGVAKANDVKDGVKHDVKDAKDKAGDMVDDAKDKVEDVKRDIDKKI